MFSGLFCFISAKIQKWEEKKKEGREKEKKKILKNFFESCTETCNFFVFRGCK